MTMISPEIRYATRAATFSLQCSVILDRLHKQDKDSTGFHRLAARAMADRALAALDAVVENSDPDDVPEVLNYCETAAESSANILRAYLNQRNPSHDAGE